MDTRRTMTAPASTLQAGRRITASLATLALVLTVAAPVTFASGDAEAQNRRQSSGQSRQASRQQAQPAAAQPAASATPATPAAPATGPDAIRAANAEALAPSRADGFVNAAQVFGYETGRVYEVWTAPMRITTITLETGERIISKAAGDTERWMIGDTTSGEGDRQQVQILIKPFRAGIATNMVITTNRRMYLLSLKAGESTEAFNALVTWTYPAPVLPTPTPATEATATAEASAATPPPPTVINRDYRIRAGWWGRPDWTPVSVSDDGRQTFITFPESLGSTEAPPLFVIGLTGEAELVNWRKQGNVYVVDRLFERAELRLGGENPRVVRIERRSRGSSSAEDRS